MLGLGSNILNAGDPRYKRALSLANKYRKVRARELAVMHGHVSAGASALLASASLALAASRFLYEKVAETGDLGMLKQASQLADSARQAELAAWELSAREGVVKRRLDAASDGMPWLQVDEPVKNKPGRMTNAARQAKLLNEPVLTSQKDMTIDDILSPVQSVSEGEHSNGMERDWRGTVQVVRGVPGHAGKPDFGTGVVYGAVPAHPGPEEPAGRE